MDTQEFDLIGEGISSLLVLWSTNDVNDGDGISYKNRNMHLKEIYCQRNKMKSGLELDRCISVNFHCNLLKNLNGLPHLPRIKELNLSSNNLGNEELTQLSLLPSLNTLDISANKFTNISILPFMPSLLKLSIAYNPIKTLEDISDNVPNLEYFDIKGHDLNNDKSDKYSYLRSRSRVIVPLKRLTKLRELYITAGSSKNNRYDNSSCANDIYNLTQQILSLEIVDGMNPNDWKADADEERGNYVNNKTKTASPLPQIDIDSIPTPKFDQVSSIFKAKLLNESAEKHELHSILEEKEVETNANNDDLSPIIIVDVKTEDNADEGDNINVSAFSRSSSPMMKTNVIVETKQRHESDFKLLSLSDDNGDSKSNSQNYSDDEDIIIRVDRSTGKLVSRRRGNPMLLLLALFKQSMKFENRQLLVAITKWRNGTKSRTVDYINIINNLTTNNDDLLVSLQKEREKGINMMKELEKRLEVEKNKYSNASKKILQQEAMLMGIRRDLEEKIRYNTQVEVSSIQDISTYKTIILNKDAELDILTKQLADSRLTIDTCHKREEELHNKLMIETEKDVRFKEKYDEWMSSREALLQSVEQSQSALSLVLERETALTASCNEFQLIINTLEEQAVTHEKVVATCHEKIAMQEADLLSIKSASNIITNELKNANNLNEKLMKRLQDTQKAFEDSISELSILSKKNNELNTQKDVYRNTIDNLRSCVRKMQESIKVKDKENKEIEKTIQEKQKQFDDEKSRALATNIQSRLETLELGLISRTEELLKVKEDLRNMTENGKEKELALRIKDTMINDHLITIQELKSKLHLAEKEIKQLQGTLEELHGTVEEVRLDNIELETEIEAKSRVEKEMKLLLEEINEVGFGKKSS